MQVNSIFTDRMQLPVFFDLGKLSQLTGITPEHLAKQCKGGKIPGAFKLDPDGLGPWLINRDKFFTAIDERSAEGKKEECSETKENNPQEV